MGTESSGESVPLVHHGTVKPKDVPGYFWAPIHSADPYKPQQVVGWKRLPVVKHELDVPAAQILLTPEEHEKRQRGTGSFAAHVAEAEEERKEQKEKVD